MPRTGKLANTLLKQRLATCGYIGCMHTPGLWQNIFRPVQFTLVVDNFGVNFVGVDQLWHPVESLKKFYEIVLDPTGSKYCGITLEWDYKNRTVNLSMPNYVPTKLKDFDHYNPSRPQHAPHKAPPCFSKSQKPVPVDDSPQFSKERMKRIQHIVGSFLYYRQAIQLTIIKTLNTLSTQQSTPTENTNQDVKKFLNYCATHPDAKIIFFASKMILQVHSDASYMNETKARSTASGKYFLGNYIKSGKTIFFNGAIRTLCKIIGVAASADEAELGSLFLNTQETLKLLIAT